MRLDNGTFGVDLICVRKLDKRTGNVVNCVLNMANISDYSGVPDNDRQMTVVYGAGQSSVTITLMESIYEFIKLVCMPADDNVDVVKEPVEDVVEKKTDVPKKSKADSGGGPSTPASDEKNISTQTPKKTTPGNGSAGTGGPITTSQNSPEGEKNV